MARGTIPITALHLNAAAADSGWTIAPADGAKLAAGGALSDVILHIVNSAGADGTVTVAAGAAPPAFRAGLGALELTIPAGAARFVVLESGRFAQADGDVYLDCSSGMSGTVAAYRLPKG